MVDGPESGGVGGRILAENDFELQNLINIMKVWCDEYGLKLAKRVVWRSKKSCVAKQKKL